MSVQRIARKRLRMADLAKRVHRLVRGRHAEVVHDRQAYTMLVDSLFSSPTSMLLSNTVGVLVPVFCWYASGMDVFLWLATLAGVTVVMRAVTMTRYTWRRGGLSYAQVRWFDREYFLGASTYSKRDIYFISGRNCESKILVS